MMRMCAPGLYVVPYLDDIGHVSTSVCNQAGTSDAELLGAAQKGEPNPCRLCWVKSSCD